VKRGYSQPHHFRRTRKSGATTHRDANAATGVPAHAMRRSAVISAPYTSSALTMTSNGTPSASKCFCPQRTLSASLVRSFRKSRVPFVSRTR